MDGRRRRDIRHARTLHACAPSLWLYPWEGAERKLSDLPGGSDWLSLGADGGVVFARPIERQTDIGLLQLSS